MVCRLAKTFLVPKIKAQSCMFTNDVTVIVMVVHGN